MRILCILIFLGFRSYVTIRSKRIGDVCSMLFISSLELGVCAERRACAIRRYVWAGACYAALSMMGGIVDLCVWLTLADNSSKFTDRASPRRFISVTLGANALPN